MPDDTPPNADATSSYSYPHLTTKELDRDIVNLFLPALDLIAEPGELERLYPASFWEELLAPDA